MKNKIFLVETPGYWFLTGARSKVEAKSEGVKEFGRGRTSNVRGKRK